VEALVKIVWAVSPFEANRALDQRAVAILDALVGPRDSIEALYVASPMETSLATAFDVPAADRYAAYPKRLVQERMRALGLARARASVVSVDSVSLSVAARLFAAHAAGAKADLVLVASHARKGVPRLFMGSFAETLVHVAKSDLLTYRETVPIWKGKPRSLLYAHDLSAGADRGFERAIAHAKRWGSALHVLHVPEPAYGIHFREQTRDVAAYRRRVEQKVEALSARIARARLEGSAEIDATWAPIADLVLARAKRVAADVVAVHAKSGRLAGFMGGSVTRQVLRSAPIPVLVVKQV